MHPVLAEPRRFGFYLVVFLPAGLLLGEILVRTGDISRLEVWLVSVPLMLLHAMSCLAAWYLAKSLRLETTRPELVVAVHLVAGTLAGTLLLGAGTVWSRTLASAIGDAAAVELFAANRAVVFGFALLFFVLAVAVCYVVLALDASRQAAQRAFEHRILAREAELKQLRAQIDPHFLFNSLNSIASLVSSDPREAREMCVQLAGFLRRSLKLGGRERISLADEIALVESYLAIEKVRFGDRLRLERTVDAGATACRVPPLLLQPLVENAVRHGVAQLVDGGLVALGATRRQDRLHLTVENDHDPGETKRRGGGIGLENVRRRLALGYGGEAAMEVRDRDGVFRVEIVLPAESPLPEREGDDPHVLP